MLPQITDRKIRIALVGCGRIASNHFKAIETFPDELKLVSVCDIDEAVCSANSQKYDVPGYTDLEKMLGAEKIDLVSICTPSGLHAAQTIKCAKHGVNVVTEKPMATKWQDGIDMVRACEDANVHLFVVKQNRRNSTLQLLKRAVDEKRFGRIHNVQINVFWTRPQEYYDQASWRGTWELDGGAFMNQASHYVDLLEWLIGPIDKVSAFMRTQTRDIEAEDSGVLNVLWRSGAVGSMNVSMLTYPKNLEGSITIIGEKGTARVGGVAVNDIQAWEFADQQPYDENIADANYETTSVYGFGHPLYYKNVIETFHGTSQAEVDGREGLKSLELLISAYLSARDGQLVSLPLEY